MKQFKYILKELGNGLVPTVVGARNTPYLVESIGAFPYEKMLMAVEQFDQVDTSALGTLDFPYPQMFVLSDFIIICTPTSIHELTSLGLSSPKISGLIAGTTWSCEAWKSFVVLVNGMVTVTRDPLSGEYSIDNRIPFGTCVGNYNNARLFIGSPNMPALGNI